MSSYALALTGNLNANSQKAGERGAVGSET
jgi:hypothetical protein